MRRRSAEKDHPCRISTPFRSKRVEPSAILKIQMWLLRCAAVVAGCAAAPLAFAAPPAGWKTYRNERFGFELSYPPEVAIKIYVDGRSGDLVDVPTGEPLAAFEVWRADDCPRLPADTIAKQMGIERASAVTQADGPDGSSSCGEPVTVQEATTAGKGRFYELRLTCTSERYADDAADPSLKIEHRHEGRKGPTFFADISQPWTKRVLMVDPVGVDPRMNPPKRPGDAALVRTMLRTLTTLPVPKPDVICIEDFHLGSTSR